MTPAEVIKKVLDLLEGTSAAADPEAELAKLAYQAVITFLKVKGLEQQVNKTIKLHEALRYKNETGDTSLLEKLVHEHFATGGVPQPAQDS